MMKKLLFIVSALVMSASLWSQAIPESEILLYKKLRYFGANLNTFGYGANGTFGKYKGARDLRLYSVDLQFVKHEKEMKSYSSLNPTGRAFFYGKQNSFIALRTMYGRKRIIAEKLRRSGVQVAYNWHAGPVFGFTKPVYLEIKNPDTDTGLPLIEKFDVDKHFNNIYGRASALRGMGELRFYPGLTAKAAMSFEYSNERERLKGIETGVALDVFHKRVPIMADKVLKEDMSNPKNHQVFFSIYINLFFGTKYDQR
jgi:hypothetical protein